MRIRNFLHTIKLWTIKLRKSYLSTYCYIIGVALVFIIIVAIFAVTPTVTNHVITLICNDWTGICGYTIREESVEKNATGQVQKRTEIIKYQSGKTLWDWLGLLAVPLLLVLLGYQFQRRDQQRNEKHAVLESKIAAANLRDEALQAYLDRMAELLLNPMFMKELLLNEIKDSNSDNFVRDVARIRTVTILRRLEKDIERQASVLHFLGDAELLEILLKKANLYGVNLQRANLKGANLKQADLRRANLERANLKAANLEEARLDIACLKGVSLIGANLEGANLEGANLDGANLEGANLKRAILNGVKMRKANLELAKLQEAKLQVASLNGANLREANLEGVLFYGANLEGVNLEGANLEGANLDGANLEGAINITPVQIKVAIDWHKAYYSPDFRQKLGLPSESSEANKS